MIVKESKENNSEFIRIPKKEYRQLLSDHEQLKAQLQELRRLIYGSKRERFVGEVSPDQMSLFAKQKEAEQEKKLQNISYQRKGAKKKQHPVRMLLAAHLPRVEQVIEPENKTEGLNKIGEEITEIMEYAPGKLFVRKIVRPKYSLGKEEGVVIAEMPSLPLKKANAGASMLAHLMTEKFVYHMPFYRQAIKLKSENQVEISSSTMNGWFNQSCELLHPLYKTLEKQVLESSYLQTDESPIGVQSSHKKGTLHRGYQWVFHSPEQGLVLFKYHQSRSREAPQEILKDFNGILQSDGYGVYQNLGIKGELILLACMAHARRYFDKAKDNDVDRSEYVLSKMQELYEIEAHCREQGMDHSARAAYRKENATNILQELEAWLKKNMYEVLPKSSLGKAIAYSLNLWPSLVGYVEHGECEIDNNLIENKIRPLALGRKNYLFAGSHDAAQRIAMMYSFFGSCKINNVDPYLWLSNVLDRINDHKANKLSELLPSNWKDNNPTK